MEGIPILFVYKRYSIQAQNDSRKKTRASIRIRTEFNFRKNVVYIASIKCPLQDNGNNKQQAWEIYKIILPLSSGFSIWNKF